MYEAVEVLRIIIIIIPAKNLWNQRRIKYKHETIIRTYYNENVVKYILLFDSFIMGTYEKKSILVINIPIYIYLDLYFVLNLRWTEWNYNSLVFFPFFPFITCYRNSYY